MARSKLNCVAIGVTEDDLAGLGGFSPSALNRLAVLENCGWASADGGDSLMIAVATGAFLDYHCNNYARCKLNRVATLSFGVGLSNVGGTFIGEMWLAASIGAEIFIGLSVVEINCVKGGRGTKLDVDIVDDLDDAIGATSAKIAFGENIVSFFWGEARKSLGT